MEFLARCLRLRLRPTTMARTNTGRRPATAVRHPRRRQGHLHEETSAGRTRATARTRGTTEAASLNAAGAPKSVNRSAREGAGHECEVPDHCGVVARRCAPD